MDVATKSFQLAARGKICPLGQSGVVEDGILEEPEAALLWVPLACEHGKRQLKKVVQFILNRFALGEDERVASMGLETFPSIPAE